MDKTTLLDEAGKARLTPQQANVVKIFAPGHIRMEVEGREPHIVQVTTTSYAKYGGVVGGGERIAHYIDEALREAAADRGVSLTSTLLALDGREPIGDGKDRYQSIVGRAWDVHSLNADEVVARLRPADIVYVHQCLTSVGMFVAAHARLLGKKVYGLDSGAGEALILKFNPATIAVYDGIHAQSAFAAKAFAGFQVPVRIIPGPVDTKLHRPPSPGSPRDFTLVASVGRVLPHKGYERIIRALPPGMSLIIVGQHYDSKYLAFLREYSVGKDLTFEDDLEDSGVRELLKRTGTFVHASTHVDYLGNYVPKPELLGLAPLEALACGAQTIVSDAASLPELGVVPGCRVFRDEAELAEMLAEVGSGKAPMVDEQTMHAAVEQQFGLAAVGRGLLDMMELD